MMNQFFFQKMGLKCLEISYMRLKHDFYVQLSCFVNSETIMSTQQLYNFTIKSLFCPGNFYFKKCYNY